MILCTNLNAAVNRTLIVDGFKVGQVQRVREVRADPGGKGANVAKVIASLGRPVTVTGFVGGAMGDFIEQGLAERGVKPAFIKVAGESRICYDIHDPQGNTQTELLEPGICVAHQPWNAFKTHFRRLASQARVVTLSGSLPRGLESNAYGELISLARQAGAQVILDTSGQPLRQGLQAGPHMVKPNRAEVEALLSVPVRGVPDCLRAATQVRNCGAEVVVISLGGEGSVVVSHNQAWEVVPPVVAAVNTVGCGDALVAGFAIGLAENRSLEDTIRLATAAAAANAQELVPGECDPREVERLVPLVGIRSLPQ